MNVTWQKSLMKAIVWVAAEIILNCVGLDDLADYSEFVFERNDMMCDLNSMCTQKGNLAFREPRTEYKVDIRSAELAAISYASTGIKID